MCSVRLRYSTVVAMASTVIAHGASPFPSSIHSSCCWNLETARKKWRSRSGNVRFQPYLTVSGSGTFQQFQRRRRRRLIRRNLILAGERDHKFIIETVVCVWKPEVLALAHSGDGRSQRNGNRYSVRNGGRDMTFEKC